MPFDILEMTSTASITRKTLPDLRAETVRAAADALSERTAWIVQPNVREELAKLVGVIEDRGKKHPAVPLSRPMNVKGPEIPMIDGEYSSDGKLRQSVQRFLEKCGDGPQRLYIIAVADDLFAALRKTASEPFFEVIPPVSIGGRSGAVLDLMGTMSEPSSLREKFIGKSADAIAVRQFIMRAALADDTVLITGDTGTGKEIVARQIHYNSPRKDKPFVPVNCGAFPRDLLESELFGHVKGAFTGALTSSAGLWASADGGTLFLDEIGELIPSHQAKLLRALQEKRIRRVGGATEIAVNARIICATNRDLFTMVQAGHFREDLFYRLREFLIITPPLREHLEDIPLLAQKFWKDITKDENRILPEDIVSALQRYSWPGNVREFRMVLAHLYGLFRTDKTLDVRHLQAVFEMQGLQLQSSSSKTTPAAKPRPEGFSSFRHLRRVYETIRAVEHRLSPLLNGERANSRQLPQISTGIANLLNELDLYGHTPCYFSPHTFENISLLSSRLVYFLSECEQTPAKAVNNLRDGTREIIEDAVADILAEIERTLTESL